MKRKLYRLPEEGMIAGVAAGLAKFMQIDVTVMRLLFVAILFLSGGTAIIAYIVMAIVIPTPDTPKSENFDLGDRVEGLAGEIKESGRAARIGNYLGIALIIFGVWLLAGQIFPGWFDLEWNIVWPVIVILLGVWIITRGKSR